ncbi:McrB family protein [Cupriavidus sp. IK-TO18]|uniref:McrB family protein n=1 Tax=Cupriavidus sp. IK-TO18 TaxID=2782182 RepID=UPI001C551778|nr:AAA family ATPase [Cupriavidus sp. IK-TO18]
MNCAAATHPGLERAMPAAPNKDTVESRSANSIAADAMPPLNQILFGPPGTGKTYETINAALEVLSPEFLAAHGDDRRALKAHFDALVAAGDIRFVTFHQSFSYEDFVEGIRAEQTEDGQLSYSVVDGVFKSICLALRSSDVSNRADGAATAASFKVGEKFGSGYQVTYASADILELKKPNGNGLAFSMRMLELLASFVRGGQITIEDIREKRVFDKLQNSTLEPYLVNGYNNILPAFVDRLLTSPAVASGPNAEAAKPTRNAKVLIIDEINRRNVSRVLGELITLIEPSKRAGCPEALEVTLPYSKDRFSVPPNLHLIGTMNTADRSLAGLDLALRRRFSFREMPPRPELLEDVDIDGINVAALLQVMNERIELLLDRDHCIGHAYFMPLVESPTLDALAQVFRAKILPLLQEYFFEDWLRIQWVFNDHRKSVEHRFVHKPTSNVAQLFGEGVGIGEQNQRWTINELAFSQAEAYIGVIDPLGGTGA